MPFSSCFDPGRSGVAADQMTELQVKVSQCTGISISGSTERLFIIYPNPNSGEFEIEASAELTLDLVNEFRLTESRRRLGWRGECPEREQPGAG